MKRVFLSETASTNDYIRRYLGGGENVVVCARRQTEGRGTKGRSFSSEDGGVYLSALTFYENLPAERAFTIMAHAAVAVCKTVGSFGLCPEIKWCNDVLVGGKKIAGILIENALSGGFVRSSIVGIGLNVLNPLTGLEEIAVGMKDLLSRPPAAETVRDLLIENYIAPSEFSDYLGYVRFLGEQVLVREGERSYPAVAREILPDGRLLIEERGERRVLSAAEISFGAWRRS